MKIFTLVFLALTILLPSCQMKPKTEMPASMGAYSIIWKYRIKPESREVFEHEYGPRGSWYQLFSESKNYTGSFLHRSDERALTYILIDTWTDQQSYEDFKKSHAETYHQLSARFESLYESEERIGAFNRVE